MAPTVYENRTINLTKTYSNNGIATSAKYKLNLPPTQEHKSERDL